eukprot:COSAG06_NODE_34776_length_469_cov_1.527027_1_plen_49_part_10
MRVSFIRAIRPAQSDTQQHDGKFQKLSTDHTRNDGKFQKLSTDQSGTRQ